MASNESRNGFEKISNEFEISHSTIWKIGYKWRKFKIAANMPRSGRPSRFTPRADRKMLKAVTNSLVTVDVKVHACTIRKRLHKLNFHGRLARRKPLLSKSNI